MLVCETIVEFGHFGEEKDRLRHLTLRRAQKPEGTASSIGIRALVKRLLLPSADDQ
jgi:hypothetical protein